MKKKGIGEKPHLKKRISGLARVMGRSGLAESLHWLVFWQTQTGLATGSTGSWVDPLGQSGFNNYAVSKK